MDVVSWSRTAVRSQQRWSQYLAIAMKTDTPPLWQPRDLIAWKEIEGVETRHKEAHQHGDKEDTLIAWLEESCKQLPSLELIVDGLLA
jgi:hypothetical protein